jgi:predicted membrane-bound spermidine synthase
MNLSSLRILLAIFFAGVVSLLMELSLLREYSFVAGSTSVSNSVIISSFLLGLTLGAYLGSILARRHPGRAALLVSVLQAINIAFIVVFVLTKNHFIYRHASEALVTAYFVGSTLVPSVTGGALFSLFVSLLYGSGPRFIAHIYAISTLGNVVAGLLHGLVLLRYAGMRETYVLACLSGALSIALLAKTPRGALPGAGLGLMAALMIPSSTWTHNSGLSVAYEKDDPNGVVLAFHVDQLKGFREADRIDVTISGDHNCSNFTFDIEWHKLSVDVPFWLSEGRARRFLMLGYCSGQAAAEILRLSPDTTVDVAEINAAIFDMAARIFPEYDQAVRSSGRATIIHGEFRNRLRFLPTSEKYDVAIVDITVHDPFYLGLFTKEFFREISDHMTDDGILFFGYEAFVSTAREVFPYLYVHSDPRTARYGHMLFSKRPIAPRVLRNAGVEPADLSRFSTVVWTDERAVRR